VGFRVVDALMARLGVSEPREKFKGLAAEVRIGGRKIWFLKPQTFMNVSGESVSMAARNNISVPSELLVVTDDADLQLGKVRVRKSGSAGGHNGLKSIIASFGSSEFPRVRIGVGRNDSEDLVGHVLGTFSSEENTVITEAITRATDAVACCIEQNVEAAMNRFNQSVEQTAK
jgi:peptidyl-tRNA hydrolase, PTH1 family